VDFEIQIFLLGLQLYFIGYLLKVARLQLSEIKKSTNATRVSNDLLNMHTVDECLSTLYKTLHE
jgi:hypothetical protein